MVMRLTNVVEVTFIKAFGNASRGLLIGLLIASSASRAALYYLAIFD